MLDSLRDFAKSWPGKVLGAFLLVGTAGFGINNVLLDFGSNTVARVGNEEISSNDFLRIYQQQLNAFAQQTGRVPTGEEAMALGLPSMVLQNMAQNAAMDELGKNLGLGVSEQQLGQMLRADPSFGGTLGTFDAAMFSQVLQNSGVTESEYFEIQTDAARREQLTGALFADTAMPETAKALLTRFTADERTIDYFTLNETSIEAQAEPTEEELVAYLSEHQSEFRTVETRQVRMLRLSPADLAATKTVDEAAVAAEYERTSASLTQPERRTIQQVVLTPEQAATFEAGKAAGTPFDVLVAQVGATPTELGTLAQAQVTDTALASAAFGLAEGDFAIISGVGGQRAIHVSAIDAGGLPPLEEVREQISTSLALVEARDEIADVQDGVEELRAAFQPLSDIAERYGLPLYEADVTASGVELDVIPDLAAEDRARLSQAIFRAEEGALTAALPLAGNGNLYFDLVAIEPARDQTLDEVREDVLAALVEERTNDAILAAAEDAVQRLESGESIADVAASYGAVPQLSSAFTRNGSEDETIDSAVASAAFAGGPDHVGTAVSQFGDFVVFDVVSTTPTAEPLPEETIAALENEARNDLYGDFVTGLRDAAGLRINQQALTSALALIGQ
jgi:peptidyl-prolyl cis-trans isomerase D